MSGGPVLRRICSALKHVPSSERVKRFLVHSRPVKCVTLELPFFCSKCCLDPHLKFAVSVQSRGQWASQHYSTTVQVAASSTQIEPISQQDQVVSMEDNHGSGSLMDVDVTTAPAAGAEKAQEHVASYQVDTSLLRYIVGTGGTTKAKIESDSAAQLNIPSKSAAGKFNAVIIVKGPTQEAVSKAMKAIEEVVDQAVRSPNYQYTHFISLPLALHGSLVDELVSFEETVLGTVNGGDEDVEVSDDEEAETMSTSVHPKKSGGDLGIDKSIFVNAKTFHLTVLMLKLWNEDRIKTAMDVLQKTRVPVLLALDSQAVEIDLNGVDCMTSNPAKAHVLYAKVQEAGQGSRLMAACKVLIDAFTQAGLVMDRDKDQPLKLHATLMNTSHRKRGKRGKSWKRKPFDARQIIEQYGAKEWGRYIITEAHLSQRFAYDGNGYYHCCSSIQFP